MPIHIIDLQRRLAETGRIRIGHQVDAGKGKTRPEKLETFRLTSPDRLRIQQAAEAFGGTVTEWTAPAGKQWEVITDATALDVIVPPADMAFTQWFELWSAGGCQRRCDGVQESLSEGPCLCQPDARECDIHTRLSVMLAKLPGLGVWRIDTQGYYAAVELQGAVDIIQRAAGTRLMPARLLLVQRMVKRVNPETGRPVTRRFPVPVLDISITPGELLKPERPAIGNGSSVDGTAPITGNLTPVPAVTSHAAQSVAGQLRESTKPQERPRRENAAAPIPSTGIEPRTADQATADARAGDGDAPGSISPAQRTKLFTELGKAGYDTHRDRDRMLEVCETLAGRDLTGPYTAADGAERTTKNLSCHEATKVINDIMREGTVDRIDAMLERSQDDANGNVPEDDEDA